MRLLLKEGVGETLEKKEEAMVTSVMAVTCPHLCVIAQLVQPLEVSGSKWGKENLFGRHGHEKRKGDAAQKPSLTLLPSAPTTHPRCF